MAELADAPDLGLSFYHFLTVPLRATAIPRTRINKGSPVEILEFAGRR